MRPELILRSDLLDILFDNRNKQYGAYELRRHYENRMRWGVGTMLLLAAGLTFLLARPGPDKIIRAFPIIDIPEVLLTEVIDKAIKPVLPAPPPLPRSSQIQTATVNNNKPVIVPDDLIEKTEVPDLDQLENAVISDHNQDGLTDTGVPPPARESGNGTGSAAPEPPAAAPDEPRNAASVMPSFPGGEGALQRWLSRNLRPQDDQATGERIKVVVRFVVGPNGNIDRVQLIQNGGERYDNEVLRVVKKMPDWRPGLQDGRPVAVWFTIPVIFETGEQ